MVGFVAESDFEQAVQWLTRPSSIGSTDLSVECFVSMALDFDFCTKQRKSPVTYPRFPHDLEVRAVTGVIQNGASEGKQTVRVVVEVMMCVCPFTVTACKLEFC